MVVGCVFFFKQKTAYEIKECDWSSDVCSSDLAPRLVQDLVASGTWLALLGFVIFGLRWAQRTARI